MSYSQIKAEREKLFITEVAEQAMETDSPSVFIGSLLTIFLILFVGFALITVFIEGLPLLLLAMGVSIVWILIGNVIKANT